MTGESENRLRSAWWALRIAFGLVPLVAGLDKFFNMLTDWTQYLNPTLQQILPISDTTFMHVAGVIEIIVGLAILTQWTQVGSYVAMLWLAAIAVNLLSTGRYLDVAARDLVMAVGAYTLASLTEVLGERSASAERIPDKNEQLQGLGLGA